MGQYIWKCCNRIYYLFLHQRRRTSVIYWISEKPSQHLQHQFSLAHKLELWDNSSWKGQHFKLLSLEVYCSNTAWRAPQTSSMNLDDFWEWIQISLFLRIPVRQSFQKLVGWSAAKNGSTFVDNFQPSTGPCWSSPNLNQLLNLKLPGLECKLLNAFQNILLLYLTNKSCKLI